MQQSSGSIGSLAAALARAQVELINPEKSMVATIRPEGSVRASRSSATRRYRMDLTSSVRLWANMKLRPCSPPRSIRLRVLSTQDGTSHSSGEWISSDWPVCPLEDMASPKRMGAALTYARRYALFALAGIAGEDDLDAPDLQVAEPVDPRGSHAVSHHRPRPNGGDGRLGQKPSAKPRAVPSPAPADSRAQKKTFSGVARPALARRGKP